MAQILPNNRWQEITKIWKDNRWLFVIAGWLLGLITFPAAQRMNIDLFTLLHDLVPETVGILFTVLILNRLAENRATEQLKRRLIREVGTQSNVHAKAAIDWIRHEKWLTIKDDIHLLESVDLRQVKLQGADLLNANLQGANLEKANLQDANLEKTDLQGTNLRQAKLQGARLDSANLHGSEMRFSNLKGARLLNANLQDVWLSYATLEDTWLMNANLRGTKLGKADLRGADLWKADLQGAMLSYAYLQGAMLNYTNLQGANFYKATLQGTSLEKANLRNARLTYVEYDEKTILPDAEMICSDDGRPLVDEQDNFIFDKYWTPETDMSRYTDPNHPDFWQPDWVKD